MSLINQMLSDLESRQAYLEEESNSALNGLYCSDTYEYREDHSRPRLLFMLLSIILITVSIYAVFRFSGMEGFNMSFAGQALSTMAPDDGVSAGEEYNSKIVPVNRQESDVIRPVSEERDTETKSAIYNTSVITTGAAAGPVTNPDKISKQLVPALNEANATAPVTQSSGYSLPALTLADTIVVPAEKSVNEQPEPAEQKITSLLVDRTDEGYVIDMQFSER
ncbi:MAG: hypothetical protein R3318_02115, partial [Gammaproteobacteria bacterium]|nr:hypothetical protein [Gammaproteobacteria bacterium]